MREWKAKNSQETITPPEPDIGSLHGELAQPLYRFAYRFTGDSDEAQDICQEAFIRLAGYLDGTDGSLENPRAWLYRTAGNLCRDRLRRDGIFRRIFHSPAFLPDNHCSAAETAEQDQDREMVRQAFARLEIRDRLLLSLYQEGFSYAEMAPAIGIKTTSVGKVLSRAIARLDAEIMKGEKR